MARRRPFPHRCFTSRQAEPTLFFNQAIQRRFWCYTEHHSCSRALTARETCRRAYDSMTDLDLFYFLCACSLCRKCIRFCFFPSLERTVSCFQGDTPLSFYSWAGLSDSGCFARSLQEAKKLFLSSEPCTQLSCTAAKVSSHAVQIVTCLTLLSGKKKGVCYCLALVATLSVYMLRDASVTFMMPLAQLSAYYSMAGLDQCARSCGTVRCLSRLERRPELCLWAPPFGRLWDGPLLLLTGR